LLKGHWLETAWEKDLFHMPERGETEREGAPGTLAREGAVKLEAFWLEVKVLSGTD
jgi:hypothetical protein